MLKPRSDMPLTIIAQITYEGITRPDISKISSMISNQLKGFENDNQKQK